MASHRGGIASDRSEARQALADARCVLETSFNQAAASCGVVEHHRVVAGHGIRLLFAGDALIGQLFTALDHLPAIAQSDALTVYVWDSASTGTALGTNPLLATRTELTTGLLFRSEPFSLLIQHDDGALTLLDESTGTAFHCVTDSDLSIHHRGAPLRTLLSWWLERFGCHLVHSGAVGLTGSAALITGPPGAGKSTTVLACVAGGMSYLGDDYVALESDPAIVHSVYRSAKLDRSHRERHPRLLPFTVPSKGAEKALGFLDAGDHLKLPVRAIILPMVTGERGSSARRTTGGRALLAFAPSTLMQVPGEARESLRVMRDVVASVPAFELRLGTDLDAAHGLLRGLLEDG